MWQKIISRGKNYNLSIDRKITNICYGNGKYIAKFYSFELDFDQQTIWIWTPITMNEWKIIYTKYDVIWKLYKLESNY